MKKFAVLIPLLFVIALAAMLILSTHTVLDIQPPVKVIGQETPLRVKVENPHGVRRLAVWVEQDGARYPMFYTENPSHRLFFRGHQPPVVIAFLAGKKNAPNLKDGKARLVVEAVSNDIRGSTDSIYADIEVIGKPPSVSVDGFQHYINQGGSELVTMNVAGYWKEAGVRVGKYSFHSFAMPGKESSSGERFCLFGYPWDVPSDTAPVAFARHPGAEATAHFWNKIFPKKFRTRDLDLSDSFLEKVVGQIDPNGSGDLLTRFLKINGEMRRQNNQTLADLRLKTVEQVLWSGPFRQLGNSKVESKFADVRNYIYKGKKVDQQVHLGFDLSVVQHTPVLAANAGRVVWADNLGIYGNCIVVDHGYGLQSIYGHLSQIGVKTGDMVKKGQEMGKSGSTGLAGGDHLHFSMQVDGIQVNPVEWWDEHWIHDRIASKIPVR